MPETAALTALRERIRHIERPIGHGVLPFGVAAIDRVLPGGGLALGAVHEILGAGPDEEDGAVAAGFAAGILARLGAGPVLWCLRQPDLYGPGLAAHGLDPGRLVLLVTPRDTDILDAVEEGLRTPAGTGGLAAVVGEVGRLPMVASRRLQLAAERSGVTALLLRRWRNAATAAVERERPSAAATRWRVTTLASAPPINVIGSRKTPPLPPSGGEGWGEGGKNGQAGAAPLTLPSPPQVGRGFFRNGEFGRPHWRIELLRVRGGAAAAWEVEAADATGHVCLSAGLADRPAASGGSVAAGGIALPLRRTG